MFLCSFLYVFGFELVACRVVFRFIWLNVVVFFGGSVCKHGSAAGKTAESGAKVFGWGPELAKLLRDSKEAADGVAAIRWES